MKQTKEESAFRDTRVPTFSEKAREYAKELSQNAAVHARRGYLRYLWSVFRRGTPYTLFHRISTRFSPVLFMARVLRIAWRVLLIAERSALLLLLVGIFLALAPVFLLLLIMFVCVMLVAHRRADHRYDSLFCGQRVVAVFSLSDGMYPKGLCCELSRDYTVLVVGELPKEQTLSLFSPTLLLAPRCLYVREHYFFHLRRTLLRKAAFFAAVY